MEKEITQYIKESYEQSECQDAFEKMFTCTAGHSALGLGSKCINCFFK